MSASQAAALGRPIEHASAWRGGDFASPDDFSETLTPAQLGTLGDLAEAGKHSTSASDATSAMRYHRATWATVSGTSQTWAGKTGASAPIAIPES